MLRQAKMFGRRLEGDTLQRPHRISQGVWIEGTLSSNSLVSSFVAFHLKFVAFRADMHGAVSRINTPNQVDASQYRSHSTGVRFYWLKEEADDHYISYDAG